MSSLAEMVRRCPRKVEELRSCWGFGGAGLKAQKKELHDLVLKGGIGAEIGHFPL